MSFDSLPSTHIQWLDRGKANIDRPFLWKIKNIVNRCPINRYNVEWWSNSNSKARFFSSIHSSCFCRISIIYKIILGWLKIKLQSQGKWHRRYCIIDWDKAALFISSKIDGRYRDWIKLLPNILISDCESQHDNVIEIKVDSKKYMGIEDNRLWLYISF